MQIKTVGVLGCGLMGSGIAQVCAAAGYRTIVREVDDALLQKGLGRIRKFLDDGVAKGKVAAEARDKTLASLTGTTRIDDLRDHAQAKGYATRIGFLHVPQIVGPTAKSPLALDDLVAAARAALGAAAGV